PPPPTPENKSVRLLEGEINVAVRAESTGKVMSSFSVAPWTLKLSGTLTAEVIVAPGPIAWGALAEGDVTTVVPAEGVARGTSRPALRLTSAGSPAWDRTSGPSVNV